MINVSDHAALRFIQRKHGIDADGLKHHIVEQIPADLVKKACGNLDYSRGDVTYIIRNYTIITVAPRK